MPYRYELHCHTNDGSLCGSMPAAELIELYKNMGYSGMFITDHFTGNSVITDETPWAKRVRHYADLYEKAKKAGEKRGISVFFGFEYTLAPNFEHLSWGTGNDFLILNPSVDWLYENGDAFAGKVKDLFARLRESGAFIVHAHPFNEKPWVECIRLLPGHVDAVEIYNANLPDIANDAAKAYAEVYNLPVTAGSDLHNPNQPVAAGVETEKKCESAEDLIEEIRSKRIRTFTFDRGKN
jgi:histidinol phosphatase-like PHP family hydrolase